MTQVTACRFPFTDCTGCEKCAVPDRYEANAELRRSLGSQASLIAQTVAVAAVSFVLIFGAGFVMAAIFDQGRENWKNVNLAYEEDARG